MSSFGSFTIGSSDYIPARDGEYYTTLSTYNGNREWFTVSNLRERTASNGDVVYDFQIGYHQAIVTPEGGEKLCHVTTRYTFTDDFDHTALDHGSSRISSFVDPERLGRILLGAK